MQVMRRADLRRALPVIAVVSITAYGALLRLDALVSKYGDVDHPRWAAVLTRSVAPLGAGLRPYNAGWPREQRPYEGGDPINYLRFAREMTHFYQPHVREPVFLALTRGYLAALADQDVAVSFASATGSTLAICGTYLLAATLMPPAAALGAALVMATEFELITWSVDGWRDDLFMAGVVWTAWALLRLRRSPTTGAALVAGVCAGAVCLTRITALSFIVPGLAWIVIDGAPSPRGARARAAALALAALAAVVGPYLVSCAIATGDPLIAINYHTIYYRAGEGMPYTEAMSATDYLRAKFARDPIATIDTGFMGLFVEPFVAKWGGLPPALGAILRSALMTAAVAGLLMFPFSAPGRLVLVVLFTSLLPYAWTWNVAGGNAWRFTMHVYPLYLAAAFYAASVVWRFGRAVWRERANALRRPTAPQIALAGGVLAAGALVPAGYVALPWLVVREQVRKGEDVNIETGRRDRIFYRAGWSAPHPDGVVVRVSNAARSRIAIPLPAKRAYDLVVRADPVLPGVQQYLSILFNGQFVARFRLTSDPLRMGSYRVALQPSQIRVGRNDLTLVPDTPVLASSAGARFSWLPPDARIGVRVWYVRILSNLP